MSGSFTKEVEVFFKERGYNGDEFKMQMQALTDLIAFAVYEELKQDFPDIEKQDSAEDLKKFLSKKLPESELQERIGKVGMKIMKEYAEAIG